MHALRRRPSRRMQLHVTAIGRAPAQPRLCARVRERPSLSQPAPAGSPAPPTPPSGAVPSYAARAPSSHSIAFARSPLRGPGPVERVSLQSGRKFVSRNPMRSTCGSFSRWLNALIPPTVCSAMASDSGEAILRTLHVGLPGTLGVASPGRNSQAVASYSRPP